MIKIKKLNLRICSMNRWIRSMLRTNSTSRTSSSICLTGVQVITAKAQVVVVEVTLTMVVSKKAVMKNRIKTKITKRRKITKNKTKIHLK